MKLTKYEHACMVLEEQGKKLVIDPGGFTPTFGDPADVVAVVVTHEHADHFDPGHLRKILDNNPGVQFFVAPEVAEKFQKPNVQVPQIRQIYQAGPFKLQFYGEQHAIIHRDLATIGNIGVMVNDTLFYPGDALTEPGVPVQVLAMPADAPWLHIGQAIDYIRAVMPGLCIPTHNGLLSANGHAIHNNALGTTCEKAGAGFTYLQPGESLVI